MLIRANW